MPSKANRYRLDKALIVNKLTILYKIKSIIITSSSA